MLRLAANVIVYIYIYLYLRICFLAGFVFDFADLRGLDLGLEACFASLVVSAGLRTPRPDIFGF